MTKDTDFQYPHDPYREPVSRSIAGPVRTAVQLVPSAVLTEFIDAFLIDLSERQYLALSGLLLLVFSWGQNLYEQKTGVSFLR